MGGVVLGSGDLVGCPWWGLGFSFTWRCFASEGPLLPSVRALFLRFYALALHLLAFCLKYNLKIKRFVPLVNFEPILHFGPPPESLGA